MGTDEALLKAFAGRDKAAEVGLWTALRKAAWAVVATQYPHRKPDFEELSAHCLSELWRLREEGKLPFADPLSWTVRQLLRRLFESEGRERKNLRHYAEALPRAAADDGGLADAVSTARLWDKLATLVVDLTPEAQRVFAAVRAALVHGGPEVALALGITPEQARSKVHRLKLALIPRAVAAGLVRQAAGGGWEVD